MENRGSHPHSISAGVCDCCVEFLLCVGPWGRRKDLGLQKAVDLCWWAGMIEGKLEGPHPDATSYHKLPDWLSPPRPDLKHRVTLLGC